jgi:TolA-binding protein
MRLRQRRIRKLYEAGLRLVKQGRYTHAFGRFRTVVRLQPDNLQARLKLGVLQARLGDHAGANETVRWVRKNVGDDAADRLRQAQLKAMARRKP